MQAHTVPVDQHDDADLDAALGTMYQIKQELLPRFRTVLFSEEVPLLYLQYRWFRQHHRVNPTGHLTHLL